ncbi:MAG TPA: hypothetical protein VE360_01530 [Pyrinomonadaceae bacterium]|nr:hypothetical protein [Pyrinomonadaceae bacterium]
MIKVFVEFAILAAVLAGLYLAFAVLYYAAREALSAYRRYRGTRVVVCPETREYVAVGVDARHAAATAAAKGEPELVLTACTCWPERAGCDQACVAQIERAPEDCLVRAMLNEWYAGKSCHFCGQPFGTIHWHDHKPALLTPDHLVVEWKELRPELVPDALRTHRPVCWDCAVAETFRAEHPELVTDRDSKVATVAARV